MCPSFYFYLFGFAMRLQEVVSVGLSWKLSKVSILGGKIVLLSKEIVCFLFHFCILIHPYLLFLFFAVDCMRLRTEEFFMSRRST